MMSMLVYVSGFFLQFFVKLIVVTFFFVKACRSNNETMITAAMMTLIMKITKLILVHLISVSKFAWLFPVNT